MFLLPLIDRQLEEQRLLGEQRRRASASPTALILAPTRELASQIHEQAERLCQGTPLRTAIAYGGADVRSQAQRDQRDANAQPSDQRDSNSSLPIWSQVPAPLELRSEGWAFESLW